MFRIFPKVYQMRRTFLSGDSKIFNSLWVFLRAQIIFFGGGLRPRFFTQTDTNNGIIVSDSAASEQMKERLRSFFWY